MKASAAASSGLEVDSVESIFAAYAIGAYSLTIGLVALLHTLEPEFDPSWRMPSEYALGRYGILMRVAFIAGGTAVISLGVALAPAASPTNIGLCIVALGPIGAAFFDTDPVTTPRASYSRRGNIHSSVGSLYILGFPVAATIVGIERGLGGRPASRPGGRGPVGGSHLVHSHDDPACAGRRPRLAGRPHRLADPRGHAYQLRLGGARSGHGACVGSPADP